MIKNTNKQKLKNPRAAGESKTTQGKDHQQQSYKMDCNEPMDTEEGDMNMEVDINDKEREETVENAKFDHNKGDGKDEWNTVETTNKSRPKDMKVNWADVEEEEEEPEVTDKIKKRRMDEGGRNNTVRTTTSRTGSRTLRSYMNSTSAGRGRGGGSTNPYITAMKKTKMPTIREKEKMSLPDKEQLETKSNLMKATYASKLSYVPRELIKGGNKIRIKFQFTPTFSANDPREIIGNILEHLEEIDDRAQVIQWDEEGSKNNVGPIKKRDLIQSSNFPKSELKKYVSVPSSTIREGYTQGMKIWNVQVQINTIVKKENFRALWVSKKKQVIGKGQKFTSINMSCIQDAPKAILIGMAQGSTEGMNEEIINNKLEEVVGVKGIRVSYQTIHQPGITKKLWENANRKAKEVNAPKSSRDYLDKKYAWAPEGLGVYVSDPEIAEEARKKMMSIYGATDEQGIPPKWPGGECMRFIPLKESYIKSERTRKKVDRRVKMHVYLKAHERVIMTNFKNINGILEDNITLQEKILAMQSKEIKNIQLFRHFKKMWSSDPLNEVWALSVHKTLLAEAESVARTLEDTLEAEYGETEMKKFVKQTSGRQMRAYNQQMQNTNDDDWFDEEDDKLDTLYQSKGIIAEGYETLFEKGSSDNNSNDSDEIDWDMRTNQSAGTEFSAGDYQKEKEGSTTDLSSLTNSINSVDLKKRTMEVTNKLRNTFRFKEMDIESVIQSEQPYQAFASMISASVFNIEDTASTLNTLRMSRLRNTTQGTKDKNETKKGQSQSQSEANVNEDKKRSISDEIDKLTDDQLYE